ncbi:Glycosyltransferase involved in cell wall bisynthesis [Microbacterium hydrothermale]|uniref:glycosyltransferase n=1 Tax=Microbacterium hydrothermale TaxID=857427 RepID=UPI0022269DD9|nr:glycosyltransferase [Microbacterium hydrothermale]MCW2163224.1 Glycosyltransferase involved in cell wall bisynthesis [Microbacterium hydrothermale]
MRIVSVTAHVPYEGVPHAGGQYVLAHLRALRSRGHEVTLVAPAWRGNDEAARRLRAEADVEVILCAPRSTGRVAEWWDIQQIRLFPVRPPRRFHRALVTSAAVRRAVRRADVVEAQWTELGWTIRALHGINPAARHVVIAHDVISQTYERVFAATRPATPARLLGHWRSASVARDERRVYRDADAVLAFSGKDAAYVRGLSDGGRGDVLRPPFPTPANASSEPPAGPPTVLFVGAFFRDVNAEAAHRLIDEIIPLVRRDHPEVRFVLAGAGPSDRMRAAAAADPLLEVTGEVGSLDPFYARATAAVVPLRMGAGLAFKTVDALTRGIPVVSTTVGAEGLVGEGAAEGLTVADDSAAIAAALSGIVADPAGSWRSARTTAAWARAEFSAETFPHRLERALTSAGGPS